MIIEDEECEEEPLSIPSSDFVQLMKSVDEILGTNKIPEESKEQEEGQEVEESEEDEEKDEEEGCKEKEEETH